MKQSFKKKIFGAFIISIFFIIFSCNKNLEKNKEEQKIETVSDLSKSQSFTKFVSLLDEIEGHLKNAPQLKSLEKEQLKLIFNSNCISENQLSIVAKYSGYNSLEEFTGLFKKQDSILSNLKLEFKNIKNISIDTIQEAILNIHALNILKVKSSQISPEELCKRIYNNCTSRATATYTAAAVGCTITAIGVGAGTAIVGGVVYQIGCGGLAYWYLLLQRDECSLNYETCLKNKT